MNKEDIRKWLKNKDVRVWKRALYLLYEEDELLNMEVATTIAADQRGVRRVLTKLQLDSLVEFKKDRRWHITPQGIKKVEHDQKRGDMPIRL